MCEISIAPLHSPPSGQLKQVCKIMLYNRKKEKKKKKNIFSKEFSVFFIDSILLYFEPSFLTHSSPFTFVLFKYCVSSQSIGFFHPTSRQNDWPLSFCRYPFGQSLHSIDGVWSCSWNFPILQFMQPSSLPSTLLCFPFAHVRQMTLPEKLVVPNWQAWHVWVGGSLPYQPDGQRSKSWHEAALLEMLLQLWR